MVPFHKITISIQRKWKSIKGVVGEESNRTKTMSSPADSQVRLAIWISSNVSQYPEVLLYSATSVPAFLFLPSTSPSSTPTCRQSDKVVTCRNCEKSAITTTTGTPPKIPGESGDCDRATLDRLLTLARVCTYKKSGEHTTWKLWNRASKIYRKRSVLVIYQRWTGHSSRWREQQHKQKERFSRTTRSQPKLLQSNFGFVPSAWLPEISWPGNSVGQLSRSRDISIEYSSACSDSSASNSARHFSPQKVPPLVS